MATEQGSWRALVLFLTVCVPRPPVVDYGSAVAIPQIERMTLSLGDVNGISGVTLDDDGALWSIPERRALLVPLQLTAPAGVRGTALPLVDVPAAYDTESIAFLGGSRFVLGTESVDAARRSEVLWVVEHSGDVVRVVDTLTLRYETNTIWPGVRGNPNEGVEGLCVAEDTLVAAIETPGTYSSRRYAPLGVYSLDARQWSHRRLYLTSDSGRVSALSCRPGRRSGELDVIAIERHYGVSRLLYFALPLDPQAIELNPTVLLDLHVAIADLPNIEALAWLPNGDVVLVSDNQLGQKRVGDTEAFVLRALLP